MQCYVNASDIKGKISVHHVGVIKRNEVNASVRSNWKSYVNASLQNSGLIDDG